MRKIFFAFLLLSGICAAKAQTIDSPYFVLDPTLTPDAKEIVFSFEGDLWKVPVAGGSSMRLTAMVGIESRPAVSTQKASRCGRLLLCIGEVII